ncbi:MAG: biotin/lipoyl-containing protein [Candidatus Promineifilaceae bacterium]
MASEIVMPQLGLSMDSGQIVEWLKESGDQVKPGDLLLTVESDKSTVDVEAVEAGILHILRGPEDGEIHVGEQQDHPPRGCARTTYLDRLRERDCSRLGARRSGQPGEDCRRAAPAS